MYNKAITLIGIQGRILPIFLEVLITMTTKKKKNTHTQKKDVGPGVGNQLCHFLVKRPCTVQLFLLQFSSL